MSRLHHSKDSASQLCERHSTPLVIVSEHWVGMCMQHAVATVHVVAAAKTCTYDWALSYNLEGAVAWVMPSHKLLT